LNALYHVAHKKVEAYDRATGKSVKPDKNNAYKFELFIHNFLPFCEDGRVGALKVKREVEFAPVKNKDKADGTIGEDTPKQARKYLMD
jgi:UDP-N-acetylglucosamine pyrophosphorylase